MTDLVAPTDIERIVGARRMIATHVGRACSQQGRVYILHSKLCLEAERDIRRCWFSIALDAGIDLDAWAGSEDQAVILGITRSRGLVPLTRVHPDRRDDVRCGAVTGRCLRATRLPADPYRREEPG